MRFEFSDRKFVNYGIWLLSVPRVSLLFVWIGWRFLSVSTRLSLVCLAYVHCTRISLIWIDVVDAIHFDLFFWCLVVCSLVSLCVFFLLWHVLLVVT